MLRLSKETRVPQTTQIAHRGGKKSIRCYSHSEGVYNLKGKLKNREQS